MAFKIDAFNVFNTKNLLTPNTSIGSANAGVITGTNGDNRDFQGSVTLYF